MISEFSFESPIPFGTDTAQTRQAMQSCPGLQLPLALRGELLDLDHVPPTVAAMIDHFAPMGLRWIVEETGDGGARATAVLKTDSLTRDVWAVMILENAGTGRHQHNGGSIYGECVITLAGELDDVLDDGTPVTLGRGAVMFHAPDTVHEARAKSFWVGLYHQPRGCTPLS